MERVAMNIFGRLPRTKTGKLYTLVVSDFFFTRWTESFPLTDIEASTVAQTFVFRLVYRFGVPRQIHTYQGTQFESDFFLEMCYILGIDKTRTTPYHPQSNGLVKRFNRSLKCMNNKYV